MSDNELQPFTVGITDYDAGDDEPHWYVVKAKDTYDACILAVQEDDTKRCGNDYVDLSMTYVEAQLVLHSDRSMAIWVIPGEHQPYMPWAAIRASSPWQRRTEAQKHLANAEEAVTNLARLIYPLKLLPGVIVPVDLQTSLDGCRTVLSQLKLQVDEAQTVIERIEHDAAEARTKRQGLSTAREERARQAEQETQRQAKRQSIEDAKDELTAQRQLARG